MAARVAARRHGYIRPISTKISRMIRTRPEPAGRTVSPAGTVGPGRKRSHKQQDEDDQENGAHTWLHREFSGQRPEGNEVPPWQEEL
jgi:hypothetical protein